jgi:MFS family permease
MSAAMLVSPIALMIAGPFADRVGIRPWFITAGLSCAIMGLAGFFIPDVMGIESKAKEQADAMSRSPSEPQSSLDKSASA